MKKLKFVRKFIMTDAVLKQKADELISFLERDNVEFAERGYNATAKADFAEKLNAVNDFPADETLEAEKIIATEEKEAARNALEKTMRTILNMAANLFSTQSAKYRAFGPADITRQRDSDLARNYRLMVKAATLNLVTMAPEGLTQNMTDRLQLEGELFDAAIDKVADTVIDRDVATEERVEGLNALYFLVAKYAGIGKDIFYETNEAKYNDYVIYDTPSGKPEDHAV